MAVRLSGPTTRSGSLNGHHLRGVQPLVTLLERELDLLSFVQFAESFRLDFTEMYKDVLTVFSGDESVPFSIMEPLDGSNFAIGHIYFLIVPDDRRVWQISSVPKQNRTLDTLVQRFPLQFFLESAGFGTKPTQHPVWIAV